MHQPSTRSHAFSHSPHLVHWTIMFSCVAHGVLYPPLWGLGLPHVRFTLGGWNPECPQLVVIRDESPSLTRGREGIVVLVEADGLPLLLEVEEETLPTLG